jgi:uncharacterized protein (TIGR02246 family)
LQQNYIEEDAEEWPIFLMLFTDGVRIDLSFRKTTHILEPTDSLTKLLLDKDKQMGILEPPNDRSYITRKPSKRQYDKVLNIGINNGWNINTGKAGRWLQNQLPEDIWTAYVKTYAGSDLEHNWDALFDICNLSRRVGQAVAVGAKLFAEDGELIGYDGTFIAGRSEIAAHLEPIFASHPTASFVNIVRAVRLWSPDVAYLRAVAGMLPRGKSELNPEVHAHQTLMAVKQSDKC